MRPFVYRNNSASAINARIIVNRAAGAVRLLEMFFWVATPIEYLISTDSIFGHPAVNGVLSVGAIHQDDPGWDSIASFSSLGRSTIRFPAVALRDTPRVVAIDGVSVTGVGAPANVYFGTSAAAAHAAGIAALVKSSSPTMTRAQIMNRLETGAVDIGSPGYDVISGLGRVDAQLATRVIPSTPARHWELYP
ncbi:MAG: S8 family serine peptidase [Candidatus Sumerlaeia bacterium]|nr:S8 family serine peptidase [Candidatus Sumerlaeia bacterium]